MTDKEKENSSEEEYQFPQEEYSDLEIKKSQEKDTETAHEKTSSEIDADLKKPANFIEELLQRFSTSFRQFRNPRLLITISVILLFTIIFYFLEPNKKEKSVVSQPVQQAMTQIEIPSQPSSNNVLDTLNFLQAHSSRAEYQIRDLQSAVADMKQTMVQSQSVQAQLQKSVATLSDQMTVLSVRLNNVIAALSKPASKKTQQIVYHLRAVLPDRAWLISNAGQTLTVTLGDHIDQYGVVKSIDPVRGVVDTTSGRKIYYGENDF